MTASRGGRGKKAPYETTHVRIPVAIKEQVEALSNAYKEERLDELCDVLDVNEAVKLARQILKQKKSARQSIEKLLTGIYNEEISL